MAWVAPLLLANSSFSLGRDLWTSHGLKAWLETLSAKKSAPISVLSLVHWTEYSVCSLPWVQLMLPPTCWMFLQMLKAVFFLVARPEAIRRA